MRPLAPALGIGRGPSERGAIVPRAAEAFGQLRALLYRKDGRQTIGELLEGEREPGSLAFLRDVANLRPAAFGRQRRQLRIWIHGYRMSHYFQDRCICNRVGVKIRRREINPPPRRSQA